MGQVVRFPRPHRYAGVSEQTWNIQESTALAASDDHELVPYWYPWPSDDDDDRLFPFYAGFITFAFSLLVLLIFADWYFKSWRG